MFVLVSINVIFIIKLGLRVHWLFSKEASEARYVATMKTVRQVKTVFIIFMAFVCCWSPYVLVLLYDSSDSLPLSVHLITSMLAHLHASLNFAIYSLSNRSTCDDCQRLVARLVTCCRQMSPRSAVAATAGVYGVRNTQRRNGLRPDLTGILDDVNATLLSVDVECYQMQEMVRSHCSLNTQA